MNVPIANNHCMIIFISMSNLVLVSYNAQFSQIYWTIFAKLKLDDSIFFCKMGTKK